MVIIIIKIRLLQLYTYIRKVCKKSDMMINHLTMDKLKVRLTRNYTNFGP